MSQAFTSAGAKVYVSAAAPATEDQAGYEALSWTEVGDVTDIPQFGTVYAEVTHKPVGDRKTYKFKGSYDEGAIALVMAKGTADGASDGGQDILETFLSSDDDLSMKIEMNDNPSGTSNTIRYFRAKVLGLPETVGGADAIVTINASISISGGIVKVAAVV